MTNRKLKLAAMSVALTACVAAQPMAAHAVEGPDANADDTATPQAGPTAMDPVDDTGSTAPDTADGEEEKQEEFTPPVNDEAVATDRLPAFGPDTKTDDITIDYKPAEKPEEPGDAGDTGNTGDAGDAGDAGDTGNTGDAGDAGNTGDTGDAGDTDDTDDTKKPDGTYMEGDVIDNSKKDEITGEDGKVIGSATKEETPESSSSTTVVDPDAEVKKGESVVGKDEDGNTTITTPTETTGTETTTTTGTGTAKSDTTITDTKETEKGDKIDLDEELKNKDGVVENPTWETKEKDKLGDYTVEGVETTEGDPDSKDLTLKKTEDDKKEMSAEDIAKLLDVKDGLEKKEERDDEGHIKTTYTLTKTETSTDENGNTVTRTTYYKITGNTVETHTETKLIIRVTKGTEKGEQDVTETPVLPDFITVKNDKGETLEVSKDILESALKNGGSYTIGDRTYEVTKDEESSTKLTNEELAERLEKVPGYSYKDGKFYYNGAELNDVQINAVRKTLSYTVKVTETTKTNDQIDGGDEKKEQAENKAKLDAIKAALTEAAKKAGIDTSDSNFEEELKKITSTDASSITFKYTKDGIEHEVTFNYNGATVSDPQPGSSDPNKNTETREDVKDNTVTGTAYVTGGSKSWSQSGTITGNVPYLSSDFKNANGLPEGGKITGTDANDRITEITIGDEVYTFIYTDNVELPDSELQKLRDEAAKNGWTLNEDAIVKKLTQVTWTKTTTTSKDVPEKDNDLSGACIHYTDSNYIQKENGSYTITVNGEKISGFQQDTADSSGNTYIKVDADGNKTTITVGQRAMTQDEIRNALYKSTQYKNVLPANCSDVKFKTDEKGSSYATWKDSNDKEVRLYYDADSAYINTLTKTESTMTTINQKEKEEVTSAVQKKLDALRNGETLILTGEQNGQKTKYTITKDAQDNFSMKDSVGDVVEGVATKEEVTNKVNEIISNYASYDKLTGKDIWELLDLQQGYGDNDKTEFSNGTDSYWPEEKYENVRSEDDGTGHWVAKKDNDNNLIGESRRETTNFGHLSLDAEVSYTETVKDANGKETTTSGTGLLLGETIKFEYGRKEQIADYVELDKYPDKSYGTNGNNGSNYYTDKSQKEEAHKTGGAETAKLQDKAKMTDGLVWDKTEGKYTPVDNKLTYFFQDENNTNAFSGKRFYHITGQVACDEITKATGAFTEKEAQEKAAEVGGVYVEVKDKNGNSVYKVYRRVVDIEAYGYMTASANTNAKANSEASRNGWTPGNSTGTPYNGSSNLEGYDLRIQGLVMHGNKMQSNYGAKYSIGMETISNSKTSDTTSGSLQTEDYFHTVTKKDTETTPSESDLYGRYDASYTKDYQWKKGTSQGVEGTGEGHYTTFTDVLKKIFTGSGKKAHDEGKVSYSYRTTDADKLETSAVSKETTTKTHAEATYDYTTIETRKVTVSGEETVIVPPVDPDTPDEPDTPEIPDTPDTPVQDETPDEVVTPETPELPPVQDATPDEAVTPANPELPAVQDATALPQTGVNWFTALGMAFSGMLLMIAGAFTSLKYKEKH